MIGDRLMKEVDAWCVKNIDTGQLILGTISETDFRAKKKLTGTYVDMSWEAFEDVGYKVVKVKISELVSEWLPLNGIDAKG